MSDVLREAGWPVYLVIGFGMTALLLAIRHAAIPQRDLMVPIVGFGIVTLLCGMMGTALGLQHSIHGIREIDPELRWLVWVGLGEALNNFSLSLTFAIVTALAATIGARRMAKRIESAG